MLWIGLLLFIMKRGARSQIRHEMCGGEFSSNLKQLSGQDDLSTVPHDDSLVYFLGKSKYGDIESVQVKMMQRLFRQKVFDRYRLPGGYMPVAIDGVHIYTFEHEHCAHCLVREDENGTKQWYHKKVQASVVCANKMALPLMSEWIENTDGMSKQDCETNAVYRLIAKIRRYYPRLQMCALLDALYCKEPVFSALEAARMEWIVVLKKGAMSEVYAWIHKTMSWNGGAEHQTLINEEEIPLRTPRSHDGRFMRNKKPLNEKRIRTTESSYTWKHRIEHWKKERRYNYCAARVAQDGEVLCDYEWLLSDGISEELNTHTIDEIINCGGRARWRIENEGNNIQKNGGYNLEHCYCKHPIIMKMFVLLLDIAHIINQLIEKGSLISIQVFGTIRNISHRMLEHMRTAVFIPLPKEKRPYIRLTWDTS